MTHLTCPSCELRFAPRLTPNLETCPFCRGPLTLVGAQGSVGYQLVDRVVEAAGVPDAVWAAELPDPRDPLDA